RELADHISINGLQGTANRYFEDFMDYTPMSKPWNVCRFIRSLIEDLSPELIIEPVIDDRMHVVSWIGNKEYSNKIEAGLMLKDDYWYRFLFVDGGDCTCQNDKMKKDILNSHTYFRWQKYGSLYGISRYSMVFLSGGDGSAHDVFLRIFRTMYARMVEISLIQRASILKFSDEVTHLSGLKEIKSSELAELISDFYREYIRFVNQIYFREITAQEQGIEMYDLIQKRMKIEEQVKDLDNEIGELHHYATLLDNKEQNRRMTAITILGAIFLPATLLVGLFGINTMPENIPEYLFGGDFYWPFWISIAIIIVMTGTVIWIINKRWKLDIREFFKTTKTI
ncbi:MAG: CorA family divalent cation transporter, partial [Lentimicrobiaceae bacterium]|nr:CorA family divalent cation transporter [Lentimicrobiaceae bacterium]